MLLHTLFYIKVHSCTLHLQPYVTTLNNNKNNSIFFFQICFLKESNIGLSAGRSRVPFPRYFPISTFNKAVMCCVFSITMPTWIRRG